MIVELESKPMSAFEGHAKLVQAAKKLMLEWYEVRDIWRDENCSQFEKKYIAPLEAGIRAATMAMERMGATLEKARHDCGSSGEFGV